MLTNNILRKSRGPLRVVERDHYRFDLIDDDTIVNNPMLECMVNHRETAMSFKELTDVLAKVSSRKAVDQLRQFIRQLGYIQRSSYSYNHLLKRAAVSVELSRPVDLELAQHQCNALYFESLSLKLPGRLIFTLTRGSGSLIAEFPEPLFVEVNSPQRSYRCRVHSLELVEKNGPAGIRLYFSNPIVGNRSNAETYICVDTTYGSNFQHEIQLQRSVQRIERRADAKNVRDTFTRLETSLLKRLSRCLMS